MPRQFISSNTADALTTLLYSGETIDNQTGLQYLRARYYDPASGRFNALDPFIGDPLDPQSFHKYLYTQGDPVNGIDPTGWMDAAESLGVMSMGQGLAAMGLFSFGATLVYAQSVGLMPQILRDIGWLLRSGVRGGVEEWDLAVANVQAIAITVELTAETALQTAARAVIRLIRTARIPIFPVFQILWPGIFILDAGYIAAFPALAVLNYSAPLWVPGEAALRVRRRAAVFALFGAAVPPPGTWLGEYPFASNIQGGVGAWGRYVPIPEQLSQGGILGAFYRWALRGRPRSPFLVVPVP